jgi:hypothetical protein
MTAKLPVLGCFRGTIHALNMISINLDSLGDRATARIFLTPPVARRTIR